MLNKHTEKNTIDLDIINECDFLEFGKYLRAVRQAKGVSIRELAKDVNKTPTYLSDIENGHNKPPEKDLLEKIIHRLGVNNTPNIRTKLFDLAAKGRNDLPADVKEYIMGNQLIVQVIRATKDKPDSNQIWTNIAQSL